MIWRLEYVEDIFEDFEWFVEEFIPILEEDGEDWDYYIHTQAEYYIDELNWGMSSIVDGFERGLATQEEIWEILTEEDVEAIFALFDAFGGTEQAMKDEFETIGVESDQVDYLEYMTGYSIDGDEYYGSSGDYVSYDDYYYDYGDMDEAFTQDYWSDPAYYDEVDWDEYEDYDDWDDSYLEDWCSADWYDDDYYDDYYYDDDYYDDDYYGDDWYDETGADGSWDETETHEYDDLAGSSEWTDEQWYDYYYSGYEDYYDNDYETWADWWFDAGDEP